MVYACNLIRPIEIITKCYIIIFWTKIIVGIYDIWNKYLSQNWTKNFSKIQNKQICYLIKWFLFIRS